MNFLFGAVSSNTESFSWVPADLDIIYFTKSLEKRSFEDTINDIHRFVNLDWIRINLVKLVTVIVKEA